MVEILLPKFSKFRRVEDSKKNRWDEVARQFHEVGRPVRDRKDSWHKSIKESQRDELASLTMDLKKVIS